MATGLPVRARLVVYAGELERYALDVMAEEGIGAGEPGLFVVSAPSGFWDGQEQIIVPNPGLPDSVAGLDVGDIVERFAVDGIEGMRYSTGVSSPLTVDQFGGSVNGLAYSPDGPPPRAGPGDSYRHLVGPWYRWSQPSASGDL